MRKMNGICAWFMVGGLILLSLPSSAIGTNCEVEADPPPGPEVSLMRHLGPDCTEEEREARALDAIQLFQAFREGKGIDLAGVVIRGDLSLDALPLGKLPPELEGTKELQGLDVRVIQGLLGHRSLKTTTLYLHITQSVMQSVQEAVNDITAGL